MHALVGENGAGKSTLMKILYGMQKPDEGTITVDGEQVTFAQPGRRHRPRHRHGAPALHARRQPHRAGERRPRRARSCTASAAKARAKIKEISDAYGLGVRPDVLVEDLGVADRQRVEILKVLYRGARTLILDEPTAVLVPQEVDALFDNLRELKAEGLTVIFISHKLGEVLSVADDITVIRRGTTVASVDPADTTPKQLAELMVGSELPSPGDPRVHRHRRRRCSASTSLRLTATDPDGVVRDRPRRHRLHHPQGRGPRHRRRRGQRPGRTGRGHHGHARPRRRRRSPSTAPTSPTRPTRKRREDGIGYIPEDRHRHGLLLEAPLWENRILGHVTEPPNSKGAAARPQGAPARDTERIVAEYDVRTPGIEVTAASLSGGNQQKLIVGREMSHRPKLLIAAHPTRGVDVGAQAQIWDQIREARREGLAVLLISADLDELIGLSDTLRVMYRGRLVADADPATITPEELGSAMTGAATGHLEARPRTRRSRCRARRRRRTSRGEEADEEVRQGAAAPRPRRPAARARRRVRPHRRWCSLATGKDPFDAFSVMIDYGSKSRQPGLHPQQGDHVLPRRVSPSPSASG